jgi:hypothetical protein
MIGVTADYPRVLVHPNGSIGLRNRWMSAAPECERMVGWNWASMNGHHTLSHRVCLVVLLCSRIALGREPQA